MKNRSQLSHWKYKEREAAIVNRLAPCSYRQSDFIVTLILEIGYDGSRPHWELIAREKLFLANAVGKPARIKYIRDRLNKEQASQLIERLLTERDQCR